MQIAKGDLVIFIGFDAGKEGLFVDRGGFFLPNIASSCLIKVAVAGYYLTQSDIQIIRHFLRFDNALQSRSAEVHEKHYDQNEANDIQRNVDYARQPRGQGGERVK